MLSFTNCELLFKTKSFGDIKRNSISNILIKIKYRKSGNLKRKKKQVYVFNIKNVKNVNNTVL